MGTQLIRKVIFFYFLYLFRCTVLKQHPIKKLYNIITDKTISKSSVSANKSAEPLNLCSLLAFQFIPYQHKTYSNKESNFSLPKTLDAHLFGLGRKLRFYFFWVLHSMNLRKDVGIDEGGAAEGWGYRELCHRIETAVSSYMVATIHRWLN